MEILKLLLPLEAIPFYREILGADPYVEFNPVAGDYNFMELEIDEPIDMDIENIVRAAENYGFDKGWAAAVAHYGIKPDK